MGLSPPHVPHSARGRVAGIRCLAICVYFLTTYVVGPQAKLLCPESYQEALNGEQGLLLQEVVSTRSAYSDSASATHSWWCLPACLHGFIRSPLTLMTRLAFPYRTVLMRLRPSSVPCPGLHAV